MRFLKMHYVYNLIVTENSMTSITFFFGCLMCVLLNAFYGSVLTLIGFAIFTENTLCVLKILSIHLGRLFQNMRLTNAYCSYACGASKFQIYNVLFYIPSAKDLSYYPPSYARRSNLSNITCWYLKLLHDIPKTYLLAIQY